jgi:hypothetical protein
MQDDDDCDSPPIILAKVQKNVKRITGLPNPVQY